MIFPKKTAGMDTGSRIFFNFCAFQDLSFSFTEHPCGTCPRGQKRVLKLLHEKQKSQKLKKNLLPGSIPAVFFGKIISLY